MPPNNNHSGVRFGSFGNMPSPSSSSSAGAQTSAGPSYIPFLNNGATPNGNSNNGTSSSSSEHQQRQRTSPRSQMEAPATSTAREGECEDIIKSLSDIFSSMILLAILVQSILGLLILLGLFYLTIRPFSSRTYRRLAASIGASYLVDGLSLVLPNMRLYLTGDSDVPSPVGTSVLVCNHVWDGDWWSILMLGRCVGLRGTIKAFLRDEVIRNWATTMDNGFSHSDETPTNAVIQQQQQQQQQNHSTAGPTTQTTTQLLLPSAAAMEQKMPPMRKFSYLAIRLLLNRFLEFPLLCASPSSSYNSAGSPLRSSISNAHHNDERSERKEEMLALLRDFANSSATAPVHLLLFPEGWSLEGTTSSSSHATEHLNGTQLGATTDRTSVMAKSVEFAKREGRPQLRHLLLPRTKGFNAAMQSLRDSSPVVYDVTMAYNGYDGSIPMSLDLSFSTIWRLIMKRSPTEVHLRIKRYSTEEVSQDARWLDKQWAEKDRLLGHFARHQQFPSDGRGFCRHRVFDTRTHSIEGSVFSLALLMFMPCTVPFMLLVSIPLFWMILWSWLAYRTFDMMFPDLIGGVDGVSSSSNLMGRAGGSVDSTQRTDGNGGVDSVGGTPFFPVTPFASPLTTTNWGSSDKMRNYNEKKTQRR